MYQQNYRYPSSNQYSYFSQQNTRKQPHILRNGAISYTPQNPTQQSSTQSDYYSRQKEFQPLRKKHSSRQQEQKPKIYYPELKIREKAFYEKEQFEGCQMMKKKGVSYDIDYGEDVKRGNRKKEGWSFCG